MTQKASVEQPRRILQAVQRHYTSLALGPAQGRHHSPAPNVREVAKRCVFPMIRVSGESCGQRRNQKLHAAVARSAFSSENAKKLKFSDHFLKLRCPKIAHRCGEKRILK